MSKVSSKAIWAALAGVAVVLPMVGNPGGSGFQRLESRAAGWSCVRRGAVGVRWVAIPAGTNWVGSRVGRAGEEPRRFVTPGFWMAETETTVGEFLFYLQAGGSVGHTSQFERVGEAWRARVASGLPVVGVSVEEAKSYAAWVGRQLKAEVRLPTEEEWEYAARAGIDGAPYPWGWEAPGERSVYAGTGAVPVRTFAPNRWGLYDMAGNAAEWCLDGAVARGGSWADRSTDPLRVFRRVVLPADYRDADVGLRLLKQ